LQYEKEELRAKNEDLIHEFQLLQNKYQQEIEKQYHHSELEIIVQKLQSENSAFETEEHLLHEQIADLTSQLDELKNNHYQSNINNNQSNTTRIDITLFDSLHKEHQTKQIEEAFQLLQEERQQKFELQQQLDNVQKQLEEHHKNDEKTKQQIEHLTKALEKQGHEVLLLREAAEKEIQHLQTSVNQMGHHEIEKESLENRVRSMTREQQQSKMREQQMIEHLEEQKEIIADLEKEKIEMKKMLEELQSNKIQQDDEMFNLLRELQLKTATVNANNTVHNVNKEKTFYSSPIRPTHSHNASISDDIFFYSALGNETVFPITNFIRAERTLQHSTPSHLTNNINIYNNDDDDGAKSVSASTVNFAGSTNTITIIKEVKDETTDKMKEEKIKKLADLQKASAEMEFFLFDLYCCKNEFRRSLSRFHGADSRISYRII